MTVQTLEKHGQDAASEFPEEPIKSTDNKISQRSGYIFICGYSTRGRQL